VHKSLNLAKYKAYQVWNEPNILKPMLPESQASKPKDKYWVTNWSEYDRALVRRDDITVWFEEDFLRQHWQGQWTGKPGAPLIY